MYCPPHTTMPSPSKNSIGLLDSGLTISTTVSDQALDTGRPEFIAKVISHSQTTHHITNKHTNGHNNIPHNISPLTQSTDNQSPHNDAHIQNIRNPLAIAPVKIPLPPERTFPVEVKIQRYAKSRRYVA